MTDLYSQKSKRKRKEHEMHLRKFYSVFQTK